jgi:hypothetical protein
MENNDSDFCHYSGLPSPSAYLIDKEALQGVLTKDDINRIIEMAWEDRTTFDAIEFQFGLNESEVKELMKRELKFGSYKLCRMHN